MHEGIYFKTDDSKKYRAIAKPLSNPPPITDCLETGQYYIQQETGKVCEIETPFQSQELHWLKKCHNAQVHIQYNKALARLSYQTRLGLQPCYIQECRNAVVNKVRRYAPPVYTLTQHPTREPDASFSPLWEVNSLLPQTTPVTDNWFPLKKQENPHISWSSYTFIADANTDKVKTEAS